MVEMEVIKDSMINKVKSIFKVTKLEIDFQEEFYYPKLVNLLKFHIEQYKVEGLGNMAILEGRGLGIIKLLTIVFTPNSKRDIPFVIIDFIKMGNKITVFVEFYQNHIFAKEKVKGFESKLEYIGKKYKNIDNYIEKPNWYTSLRCKYSPLKKGKIKDYDSLCQMIYEYIDQYLKYVKENTYILKEKNTQLEIFINDLIYVGNPSSAILEKALGKDEMHRFLKDIVFYLN